MAIIWRIKQEHHKAKQGVASKIKLLGALPVQPIHEIALYKRICTYLVLNYERCDMLSRCWSDGDAFQMKISSVG